MIQQINNNNNKTGIYIIRLIPFVKNNQSRDINNLNKNNKII